ncbi:cupin domain-containing protein [Hymenobacter ginsengisoli]|uniref:Cupin domain-containing protein n=1 Tax=Hymenobacter ginsengisoli TaxID=1051626 RepID=A0ABP8PZ40_9BACT|nr:MULTISPECIES: cupin domain-containing protein [unclassified Hymenobacter]MBO2032729.1 cupin domain-containing protein [Hymenobacter sp. BT559]
MPGKISTATAPGYPWGQGCVGWHLVQNAQLGVIQETMPPGTAEVRHYHARAQQFFYVLRGEGTFELAGETWRLGPGEGIEVLAGLPHQLRNESAEPLEFLVISTPHAHGDRVLAAAATQLS